MLIIMAIFKFLIDNSIFINDATRLINMKNWKENK